MSQPITKTKTKNEIWKAYVVITKERDELKSERDKLKEITDNVPEDINAAITQRAALQKERDEAVDKLAQATLNHINALVTQKAAATQGYATLEAANEELAKRLEEAFQERDAAILLSKDSQVALSKAEKALLLTRTTGTPQRKYKTPDDFDGTSDYREWMRKVKLYFRDAKISDDEEKISCILPYLKQDAMKAVERYYQWVEEDEILGTWEDFEATLRSTYDNMDREAEARLKLDLLKMNKGTATAYANAFRTYAASSGFSYTDLMYRFKRGLDPWISTLVRRHSTKPSDLEELISLTLQVEQEEVHARILNPPKAPAPATQSMSQTRQTSVLPSASSFQPRNPSVAPGAAVAASHIPGNPRDTRDCYNCGTKGHLARNCPQPRKARQVRVAGASTEQGDYELLEARLNDQSTLLNKRLDQMMALITGAAKPAASTDPELTRTGQPF